MRRSNVNIGEAEKMEPEMPEKDNHNITLNTPGSSGEMMNIEDSKSFYELIVSIFNQILTCLKFCCGNVH